MAVNLKPGLPKASDAQARMLALALGKDGPLWINRTDGGDFYRHPTLASVVSKGWLVVGKRREVQSSPDYIFHHTTITPEGERALEIWLMVKRLRAKSDAPASAP